MIATDVDALNLYLDDHPDDQVARMALADAMLEAGDERGLGIRALAVNGKRPLIYKREPQWSSVLNLWFYWSEKPQEEWYIKKYHPDIVDSDNELPLYWADLIPPSGWTEGNHTTGRASCWTGYGNRSEVELLVASAFLRLPPQRQQDLLDGKL